MSGIMRQIVGLGSETMKVYWIPRAMMDKVFNPKFDFEKCYEADREKALEMIE